MQRQARNQKGRSGSDSSGARTKRVVGRRNVMEKFDGPALRKIGENRQTVDHPMALFSLKNRDGSPLFAVKDSRKPKKAKSKKPSRKK